LAFAPDTQVERQAGASQAACAYPDIQQVVEASGGQVFEYRLDGEEVTTVTAEVGRVLNAQGPEVLGNGDVGIGQVMAVEHNGLRVDLGPAYPQWVAKGKRVARGDGGHGGTLLVDR